jgi:hypothetical protein
VNEDTHTQAQILNLYRFVTAALVLVAFLSFAVAYNAAKRVKKVTTEVTHLKTEIQRINTTITKKGNRIVIKGTPGPRGPRGIEGPKGRPGEHWRSRISAASQWTSRGLRPDHEDTHYLVCQVYPVREVRRDLLADAGYLVLPVM